jgi:hypothetical protein
MTETNTETNSLYWIMIIIFLAVIIFFFGPIIMFNNSDVGQRFGDQTITNLLSNV